MGVLSSVVVSVLVVALVVGGIGLFIGGTADSYSGTAQNFSESNLTILNKSAEVYVIADDMSSNIQQQQTTGTQWYDIPLIVVTGGYQTLMLTFKSVDLFMAIVSGLGSLLNSVGVPVGWALGIVYTILLVVVTFAVLSVIMKWDV